MKSTTVYTSSVVFTTLDKEKTKDITTDKVYINNCSIIKTLYGSVIIDREDRNQLELYPSAIDTIVTTK